MVRRRWARKMQAALFCVLALLSGCGRARSTIQGTPIPFESIDQAIGGEKISEDSEKRPFMIVLIQEENTGKLEGLVSEAAMGRLGEIDFDRELVIAVFQGRKPTWGYAIQVQWVIQNNGEIVVITDIKNPPKDSIVQQEMTSPYHLIRVPKDELSGTLKYTLNADGKSIFQIEKTID